MTTAHRPTFNPARGGEPYGNWKSVGSGSIHQFSAKDLPGHTTLKYRQVGQASQEEMMAKDTEQLRRELATREAQEIVKSRKPNLALIEEEEKKVDVPLLLKNRPEVHAEQLKKYDDGDQDDDDDLDDDEDDEDDDEAELQRELERIKREREEARKIEMEQQQAAEEQEKLENARRGNPLLDLDKRSGSAKVKRGWNDDVVFRNQARNEPEKKKRFVNDTIRNDFHRRFLSKYMK